MSSPTPPSGPHRMTDFFALEAGEYLERLDGTLQAGASTPPPVDEMLKLARALRGSALMANKGLIARAAAGLEGLVRAVREGRRNWDAETQQITVRAVDDLKILIRSVLNWTDADTLKAEALSGELERLAGTNRTSGAVSRMDVPALDAGARAFVAREGAAIASALDRASQALRANPMAHDPLQQVTRALQPLRGLAALNDLPPLPDVLEGIERTIGELERKGDGALPAIDELFQAAAGAIAAAARDVAEKGRPDPEGATFKDFAARLVKFLSATESEPGVVPIASLYFEDAGPHVVKRGTPTPALRPATLGRLELVSHGEHLRQAADSLERAPSATQRELRAHTLAGTFRALMNAGGGPLAEGVSEFAERARDAVRDGVAVREATAFATELRRAGDILTRSSTEEEAALAGELAGVTRAIQNLGGAQPASAPIVPIESLAPAPAPKSAPAPAPPETLDETPDLAGTWILYERLTAGPLGPASLEELIAGAAPVAVTPAPARAPAPPAPAPPAAVPAPAVTEPQVVDIRTLLYRGDAARRRAAELRVAARNVSGEELRALVEEVCDLVDLATDPV